jgi:hypothetical protein
MKKLLLILFLFVTTAHAQNIPKGLDMCVGDFALCAASTCTPTGNSMTIKGKIYPEAVCECPVINGKALADIDGGNMQGSCDRVDETQVWSLFSYKRYLPQQITNWNDARTKAQECSADLDLGHQTVNCFSMSCEITGYLNGNVIASCSCPIGQSVTNGRIPPDTAFLIQSGQGDPEYCAKNPVAVTPFLRRLKPKKEEKRARHTRPKT